MSRIFSVVYMLVGLVVLLIIFFYAQKSHAYVRINVGLGLFVVLLLIVPVLHLVYIQGRVELYARFYVTVAAVALSGLADALVEGLLIGAAGELPEKYMRAIVGGTADSVTAAVWATKWHRLGPSEWFGRQELE